MDLERAGVDLEQLDYTDGLATISYAIQAHRSRRAYAEDLADELRAPIAYSQHEGDVWETHARALAMCDRSADWCAVIQDDAILGAGFLTRMRDLPADQNLACLFYRHKRGQDLLRAEAESAWRDQRAGIEWPRFLWCVGSAVRSDLVTDLLATGDGFDMRADRDDERIDRWALERGVLTWYPLPSLVQHRALASLVGHQGTRRATYYR